MRKCISILMAVLIAFSIIGCSKIKVEIEKLSVILALGFDIDSDNMYVLTAQILNIKKESNGNLGSQSVQQKIPSDVMIFTAKGKTPFEAITNISNYLGKELFYAHGQYVIIGSSLAKHGVNDVINTILRNPEARPNSLLLLTKGKASTIVSAKTVDTTIPANSIKDLVQMQSIKGFSSAISRLTFANALLSRTSAPILDIVDRSTKINNNDDNTFMTAGTAVFHNDKLIGYLNSTETRGINWIKGKVQDGLIVSDSKLNKQVSFSILKSTSKITPIVKGKKITMRITIEQDSNIHELTNNLDPMKNPKVMDELGSIESKTIAKEVNLALNKSQKKLNADVFDFGDILHRSYPQVWRKLYKNWQNIFPTIKIKLKVISNLRSPGKISKPIK